MPINNISKAFPVNSSLTPSPLKMTVKNTLSTSGDNLLSLTVDGFESDRVYNFYISFSSFFPLSQQLTSDFVTQFNFKTKKKIAFLDIYSVNHVHVLANMLIVVLASFVMSTL
jgi:hypothetical protein